jgi:hypothetical protein
MDCEGYNVSDVGAGGTTCNGTFKADEKGQLQPGQLGQIVLKCVQEYGGQ